MICNSCFKPINSSQKFCGNCGHNLKKIELSTIEAREFARQLSDRIETSEVALLFVLLELDIAMKSINNSAKKFVKDSGFSKNEYEGASEINERQNTQTFGAALLAGHTLNDLTIKSRLKVIDEFMIYESLGKYS
ncbi:NOB1 family endonuclease [Candidatus Thioglobus sp.]|nr:NOB1 family endonuclease [Candidatus Thioglobus sp.]